MTNQTFDELKKRYPGLSVEAAKKLVDDICSRRKSDPQLEEWLLRTMYQLRPSYLLTLDLTLDREIKQIENEAKQWVTFCISCGHPLCNPLVDKVIRREEVRKVMSALCLEYIGLLIIGTEIQFRAILKNPLRPELVNLPELSEENKAHLQFLKWPYDYDDSNVSRWKARFQNKLIAQMVEFFQPSSMTETIQTEINMIKHFYIPKPQRESPAFKAFYQYAQKAAQMPNQQHLAFALASQEEYNRRASVTLDFLTPVKLLLPATTGILGLLVWAIIANQPLIPSLSPIFALFLALTLGNLLIALLYLYDAITWRRSTMGVLRTVLGDIEGAEPTDDSANQPQHLRNEH